MNDRNGTTVALRDHFVCDRCGGQLSWGKDVCRCNCGRSVPLVDGIPRFVELRTHDNFAMQWKLFSDVQIDSKNGTTESRDRLLNQSGLSPEDFQGKLILEVGCGAGRFTEVMLGFGARVIALDYSSAVEACAATNERYIEQGSLAVGQADVFALPFPEAGFDMVVGYGMLQHTGAPNKALNCLWRHVRPGGLLLVDRYQLSVRKIRPFKHALRPITKRLDPRWTLSLVEGVCRALIPLQRRILSRLGNGGRFSTWVRYLLNRSPNSMSALNLEFAGKLTPEMAYRWSVLETLDELAPKYDWPCTASTWKKELLALPDFQTVTCGDAGQGNAAVVRKQPEQERSGESIEPATPVEVLAASAGKPHESAPAPVDHQ